LFIVQGDLTRLACDAWLLPTSKWLWIEEHWLRRAPDSWKNKAVKLGPNHPSLAPDRVVRIFDGHIVVPSGWLTGAERTVKITEWPVDEGAPRAWLTQMAIDRDVPAEEKARWFAEGARQFVVESAKALLITRHMLFVGFCLTDDNFHRIVDEVRKVRRLPTVPGRPPRAACFGTSLLLDSSRLLAQLWRGDIDCISVGDTDAPNVSLSGDRDEATRRRLAAANQLEILLDYISFEANRTVGHILDMRYDGLLSEDERELRDHLRDFEARASDEMRRLPAWQPIAEMLRALGAPATQNGD
jgi:hypothetical protein